MSGVAYTLFGAGDWKRDMVMKRRGAGLADCNDIYSLIPGPAPAVIEVERLAGSPLAPAFGEIRAVTASCLCARFSLLYHRRG